MPKSKQIVGLVDADLLAKGTRHPNLALLKIAGFLHDNDIPFELIIDTNVDLRKYHRIYLSRVFTFTHLPKFYTNATKYSKKKFRLGGTGFYANEKNIKKYSEARQKDLQSLERDTFLLQYRNHRGGGNKFGINMIHQMPYYSLYDDYISRHKTEKNKDKFTDYEKYSIGFLTRGCIRHCPFCVNKLENTIYQYSSLDSFIDNERNSKGRLVRPYIYLWDDNFLAADRTIWEPLLQQLIDSGRPFQFRQGLDERMIAESPDGERMVEMLSLAKYHGDFIFAFDNWKDRETIEKALKIWKRYTLKKTTKFYLFCGFQLKQDSHERFYRDIWELFQRIRILMSYGCVGYVMRHEDYHNYELSNLYIQIARWCNQQQFYKKMSFWEFTYRNQSYWEEKTLKIKNRPHLKTFEEFMEDYNAGYYTNIKICLPLKTLMQTLEKFPEHREELLKMFNYKMENLVNPNLWK